MALNESMIVSQNSIPQEILDSLNLFLKVPDGKNLCLANPYIPLMFLQLTSNSEPDLMGITLVVDKKTKKISQVKYSKLHFNEPSSCIDACKMVLDSRNIWKFSLNLPKDFYIENSFLGLACFASNYNPNFFRNSFLPVLESGSNNARFKIYKQADLFQPLDGDLKFYPWGFKYKNFSSWNHNLRSLMDYLKNYPYDRATETLLSVFPAEVIKEIIFERAE